jgi:polyphosphate kinase
VEILFPVTLPRHIRHLRDEVLGTYLADNVKARELQPDGTYVRRKPAPGEASVYSQAALLAPRGGYGGSGVV